jgi:DNA primase
MGKREKRLEKGIESMKEQIILHQEKKTLAESEGKEELARYYRKEIESISERVENRASKIHRKNKDFKKEEDIKGNNLIDKDNLKYKKEAKNNQRC